MFDATENFDLVDLVHEIVAAHENTRGPLLPILHDLQATMGFIHPDAIPLLATELNLTRADVFGVVTFYRDFRDREDGRRRVRVCVAEACQAVGGDVLAREAEAALGLRVGEVASDGSVRLDEVFCLGNCALAPSAEIDGVVYGRMDSDSLVTIVGGRQ